ncbi:MAG: nitroreductase family protein [Candidatus Helarchaeota archaeon]
MILTIYADVEKGCRSNMDVRATIQKRRSIRKFQDRPISEEQLEILMQAAQLAPSASNRQHYKFVIIMEELR